MPSTTSTVVSLLRAFFDGDHAVLADLHEGVGQHVADRRIVVAGDRGDLLNLFLFFSSIGVGHAS